MGRKRRKKIIPGVKLTGIADKGKSVGRDEEGRVVFVDNAAPGDVVDVLVYRKKKGFFQGVPKAFHEMSDDRIPAFCDHYDQCGGCKWQHITYEAQLRHKQKVVEDALTRIAKMEPDEMSPILGADHTRYYRNKLEFSFSSKRWLTRAEIDADLSNRADVLGFHPPGAYDKVVDIQHCWLQPDPSNAIRNQIRRIAHARELPFFDSRANEGFLRQLLVRISSLGQVMVVVSFYRHEPKLMNPFMDDILEQLPEIDTLLYCINPKPNDFMFDLDMEVYYGSGFIEDRLRDLTFKIGPKSFFQTNTRQAERLYDVAVEFAGLKGDENVYDLYCGIGSIALYQAGKCRQVVGIEEVEEAIEDARTNAALNGIENAVFHAGDVRDVLDEEFASRHGSPDVVITDPPRAGMHPKVVKTLLELLPPKIVYVSCNPATQARDLQLLAEAYRLVRSQAVDMFPHTHHIENVVLLQRK
ncbi:MAG: 23S rRNA (uracil(1939)-C(5))-methyltransferase RlmD [Saprospiraceae bacterium]|nr:23S rRNA (uracil(1939)-C(5))-methyltransferase RlmD [Saprospiraceae bacterium]